MKSELNFDTNSLFENVLYDLEADRWNFIFENKIVISVSGFWRLLKNNQIVLVSQDHEQLFGLTEPVSLTRLITNRLLGKKLNNILVKKDVGDLNLLLDDNLQLEIYISSTGYETYNFSFEDKHYIGLGSGEITIY